MLSDFVDDDLLSSSYDLSSSPSLISNKINSGSCNTNGTGSVVLMQPKLEAQPIVFEQQQQSKMAPIAPRFDVHQQCSTGSTLNTNTGSVNNTTPVTYTCCHCTQPIQERFLLYTRDRFNRGNYWHMQCLRCQCCDVVLADVSSTFYTKDNALLCKSDYMKRYGCRPCSLCNQVIGSNEQVMRVSPNFVYHLHCFTCIKCHTRLLKGDRYVSLNGQLFCEKDNPLKTATSSSPASKRATQTSKRGAKSNAASRAAAAAAAAAAANQVLAPPPQGTYLNTSTPLQQQTQYQHSGHISLLNNQQIHGQTTMTHSLLNNNNNTNQHSMNSNNNGSSSIPSGSVDDLL